MDVLPAHLNRDSFRDSFKGLVALEIILDLPFGFPINNIISLTHDSKGTSRGTMHTSDLCISGTLHSPDDMTHSLTT